MWLLAALLMAILPPPTIAMASLADSAKIDSACRSIRPGQLLRLRGDFGRFQGFAERVGPEGIDGLRPAPPFESSPPLPSPLEWDRIQRIEKRGNSAGKGAVIGGLVVGLACGVLAFAVAYPHRDEEGMGDPLYVGPIVGASTGLIGAAVGALIGAAVPRWHVVYSR